MVGKRVDRWVSLEVELLAVDWVSYSVVEKENGKVVGMVARKGLTLVDAKDVWRDSWSVLGLAE